jgi:hypothetical protein
LCCSFPDSHPCTGNCQWVFAEEEKQQVENRFKWRHNCVLRTLAEAVRAKLACVNAVPADAKATGLRPVAFVKAGSVAPLESRHASSTAAPAKGTHLGLLAPARDWICDFDLPEYHLPPAAPYAFPAEVAAISNRPDAYLISRSKRIIVVSELTVPMEDNVERQHQYKLQRYDNIKDSLNPDWNLPEILCLEMGCRGVAPSYFGDILRKLSFTASEAKQLQADCAYIAQYCSYLIWLNRHNREVVLPRVFMRRGNLQTDSRSLCQAHD